MKKPIVIAHRGAAAYAPENTEASFRLAMEMGADGIELDVHLSKDGIPVVIHDERLNRTGGRDAWVKDLTLAELKDLDFGAWFKSEHAGQRIMTLEEVMILLRCWSGLLNIELKSGLVTYEGLEEKVIRLVYTYGRTDSVIISSFNHYSLLKVKEIDPRIKIGLLYMAGMVAPWEYAERVGAEAIHPLYYNIVPPVMEGCKAHGILINPFTVDKPEHIKAVAAAGVDGIITNVPDIAKEIIHKM